jgi:N-acetylglucosamine-6-sulfatase
MFRSTTRTRVVGVAIAVLLLAGLVVVQRTLVGAEPHPNIVVIMTDDQDPASVSSMPRVNELVRRPGVTFARHTVSYSLCCPSRATYLTGQLSHNHDVRSNVPPLGGYGRLETNETLPVWLTRAGYVTSHIGKYLNGYDATSHAARKGVPPGWKEWHGTVDPTTYRYFGYVLNENGAIVPYGTTARDYQTDTLTRKAVDFIRRRSGDGRPFFLDVAYVAPHFELGGAEGRPVDGLEGRGDESVFGAPPVPAPRHRRMFAAARAPRPPSFDEADVSDKPAYVRERARLAPEYIEKIDRWYRARLQALQAVDEGVAQIVRALDRAGVLDSTYVVFTSDNGWLQGEHRLALRKVDAYEQSTRVPLIVRGPDVARGSVVKDWTSNVDLPATILELAGAKREAPTFPFDGRSLASYLSRPQTIAGRVVFHEVFARDQTYTAVRAGRWKWVEYTSGDRELYDLLADPNELHNLAKDVRTATVRSALADALAKMRACRGSACIETGYTDAWRGEPVRPR